MKDLTIAQENRMQQCRVNVHWQRGDAAFADQRYGRAHQWQFDGGPAVPASSPLSVPLSMSNPAKVAPEEALVAATSGCHRLCLLTLAAKDGRAVDDYSDQAIDEMQRNQDGRLWMSPIRLRPAVHDFANSIKAEVVIEEGQ
jgi:organic hydroperoxide reductase OsmC/OhrA